MYTPPENFVVDATRTGHLVTVVGEIDLANAREFTEVLDQFPDGDVSVDLAGVEFIDSTGLTALVTAHQHISQRGAQLHVEGVPSMVMKLLEITRLDEVLHISAPLN